MAENRPRSREKNITGGSKGVKRRGTGMGTGSVGSKRPAASSSSPSYTSSSNSGRRVTRSSGGGKGRLILIAVILILFFASGGTLSGLLGMEDTPSGSQTTVNNITTGNTTAYVPFSGGSTSNGWEVGDNTGRLDTSVASKARDKRTSIQGKSRDEVTIMVYMCGTDLESRSGMGTSDLQEMLNADLGDKVNLLVYTGGCNGWKNNVVSSSRNQIYAVKEGSLHLLEENTAVSMTEPETLTGFITWCNENYPANRNQLIFWDHGGGSISGFGYDEKFKSTGSMNLAEIDQALKNAGVTFDFIGFDACLMATLETALTLAPYADYMIASEETEPGVGWYYTGWLSALGKNTSMPTIEIGKNIVDDFVDTCDRRCKGQKTTLSVVDLAELEKTVPGELKAFAKSASEMIREDEYKVVSDARYHTREFAVSNGIDQVDLVHLAQNMGTKEGEDLADALLGAVKYNRTSSNMTNAYGISIYFPYKKVSKVDQAVNTFEAIGMDEEYMRCIQEFASLEVSGQVTTGGTSSQVPSLLGTFTGSSSSGSGSSDVIAELLGGFLAGQLNNITGLDRSNTGFVTESGMDTESMASYLAENYFDASELTWEKDSRGQRVLELSEKQWSLVHSLELNLFYDDGEGYVDLGYDNVFEFDEQGRLLGDTDRTWLAINGQPVAYYYEDTVDDGTNYTITGRVPVLLNGERANLILVFDNENPYGFIVGARTDYAEGETETVAKSMNELQVGDTLDFICDFYTYDGEYKDSYFLGEQMVVSENMTISNVDVGEGAVKVTYRFTDIYNQQYWTPAFTQ